MDIRLEHRGFGYEVPLPECRRTYFFFCFLPPPVFFFCFLPPPVFFIISKLINLVPVIFGLLLTISGPLSILVPVTMPFTVLPALLLFFVTVLDAGGVYRVPLGGIYCITT
jgi:hypothetical protein